MILYRAIQDRVPAAADFRSQQQLGRECTNQWILREWHDGISAYDDLDHTIAKARKYPPMGNFVIQLDISDRSGIEVRRTMRDKHHYTIYALGPILLQFIVGDPVPVKDD